MRKSLCFAFSLSLLLTCSASAATVESVQGDVLINHGEGFVKAASGAQANAGDQLMATPGSSAKLVYSDGCQVNVIPGRVVGVGAQPPCKAPYMAGLEAVPPQESFFTNPVVPFAISAGVGFAIYCAATYCRDHDHGPGSRHP
jgi:hypothetical protein